MIDRISKALSKAQPRKGRAFAYLAASLAVAMTACHGGADKKAPADALVVINKEWFTPADLKAVMPGGLSAEDSAKFAKAYIRSWIDTEIISQLAAKEIDTKEIDKMTRQYRNELIMLEYTRRMADEKAALDIAEDTIKAYYEDHKGEFVLKRPLVKGVYLKLDDESKSLPAARKLYRSRKENDIDKLDKSRLDGAVHYDYFRDRWIEWDQIEMRIPYDFGPADAFLRQRQSVDTSVDGFTYLLDISDVLHTGQPMPYEVARELIIDRMRFYARRRYEDNLKRELYEAATADGDIVINCEL